MNRDNLQRQIINPMNRTILLLLLVTLNAGCSGSSVKSASDESALSKECTEFLDGYEQYVNDYIELLKDYKSNPTDMSLMERATKMASEANSWGNKAPACSDASEFFSRQAKIQAKLSMASLSL